MIKDQIKKFLAFEWIMLFILGFFWAAAMFLPLFLTGSWNNKKEFFKNLVIMGGPYAVYLVVRSIFLMGKALVWSYLISNFFFKDQRERIFADEVFRFLVFGPIWALIMIIPIYFLGYFKGDAPYSMIVVLLCGPYAGYLLLRVLGVVLGSLGWAVQVTVRK